MALDEAHHDRSPPGNTNSRLEHGFVSLQPQGLTPAPALESNACTQIRSVGSPIRKHDGQPSPPPRGWQLRSPKAHARPAIHDDAQRLSNPETSTHAPSVQVSFLRSKKLSRQLVSTGNNSARILVF
jgi:hypothetical protein